MYYNFFLTKQFKFSNKIKFFLNYLTRFKKNKKNAKNLLGKFLLGNFENLNIILKLV